MGRAAPAGVYRIRKAPKPPTAAQQRIVGANQIVSQHPTRQRRAQGSAIGKRRISSSCSLAMAGSRGRAPLFAPLRSAGKYLPRQCGVHRIDRKLRPREIVFGGLLVKKRAERSFINALAIQRVNSISITAFGHGSKIVIDQHAIFKAGAGCAVVEGAVRPFERAVGLW